MRASKPAPVLLLALTLVGVSLRAQRPELAPLELDRPITYFIAEGDSRTGFEPGDRELAFWALDAWRRVAPDRIHLEASDAAHARIRVEWAPPGAGQYGETQALLVDGRRGARLFIHPDMESLGADIAAETRRDSLLRDAIVYLTCLHELGHAFGLEHTAAFDDIMYSFEYGGDIPEYFERYRRRLEMRDEIAIVSGLSGADRSRFRALYPPE
jgi:hypothetical protein